MKKILVLAIVGVSFGCAKMEMVWVNHSVSPQQLQKDANECQHDAVKYDSVDYGYIRQAAIAAGIGQVSSKNDSVASCMAAKGYVMQAQPPAQSTN
jgi:hypothetical protein